MNIRIRSLPVLWLNLKGKKHYINGTDYFLLRYPITAGETIYCEIDNEKLRNVKVLQNI